MSDLKPKPKQRIKGVPNREEGTVWWKQRCIMEQVSAGSPTLSELGDACHIKAESNVQLHIDVLTAKGLLKPQKAGTFRSLVPTIHFAIGRIIRIPIEPVKRRKPKAWDHKAKGTQI